jgi:hypothetical protein
MERSLSFALRPESTPLNAVAEFFIADERLGPPVWDEAMPQKTTVASIEILRLIRDDLRALDLPAGEVGGGKPWGSGCSVGRGESRVVLFFHPVPQAEQDRWAGSIYVRSSPAFWRSMLGLRNRGAEEQMVERVTQALKTIISRQGQFTGVRWRLLQPAIY